MGTSCCKNESSTTSDEQSISRSNPWDERLEHPRIFHKEQLPSTLPAPPEAPKPQLTVDVEPGFGEQELNEDDDAAADTTVEELTRLLASDSRDALAADMKLKAAEQILTLPALSKVLNSSVVGQLEAEIQRLVTVGEAMAGEGKGWFNAYQDGASSIDGAFDSQDGSILNYRVKSLIPASLDVSLAVANETQLLTSWNKLMTGEPTAVGPRTAHHFIIHYQMSFLAGLYQVDVLNEIQRYSDIENGFLAEDIKSLAKDHALYREPRSGHKRPETRLKNLWMACGSGHTMFMQVGKLQLPFSVPARFAKMIGSLAGKSIVNALANNSLKAKAPGNQWEEPMQRDELGLYRRLRECVAAEASQARTPKGPQDEARLAEGDTWRLFDARREEIPKMRQRTESQMTPTAAALAKSSISEI